VRERTWDRYWERRCSQKLTSVKQATVNQAAVECEKSGRREAFFEGTLITIRSNIKMWPLRSSTRCGH
jgi:hypothetical protein